MENNTEAVQSSVSVSRHVLDSPGEGLNNEDTGDSYFEAKALLLRAVNALGYSENVKLLSGIASQSYLSNCTPCSTNAANPRITQGDKSVALRAQPSS